MQLLTKGKVMGMRGAAWKRVAISFTDNKVCQVVKSAIMYIALLILQIVAMHAHNNFSDYITHTHNYTLTHTITYQSQLLQC